MLSLYMSAWALWISLAAISTSLALAEGRRRVKGWLFTLWLAFGVALSILTAMALGHLVAGLF